MRIKTWHIIIVVVVFTIFTILFDAYRSKNALSREVEDCLTKLDSKSFKDSTASGQSFVLFYVDGSDLCKVMSDNLCGVAAETQNGECGFYKLNLEEYPGFNSECNISGVPSILVFKDGTEIKRIMGIVSESNLKKIYNKTMK